MILELFQQADANNDGCVTKSELTAAMQGQGRGNQRGTRPPARPQQNNPGNIPGGNPNADGPQHGPPPQPGQILPEPVIESLSLTENQTKQLAVLQATVYKRLARILTDEQQEQLANTRPPERPE